MNNHGGKRPNSGRKPGRPDGRRWRSVKMALTDAEFATIKAIPPEDRRRILLQHREKNDAN